MNCHLIEEAKQGKLLADGIKLKFDIIEEIYESDKFDVQVVKCKECEQVYIYCFKEYNTANFEDYYWTFWVPAEPNDIVELKKAPILFKFMGELIAKRSSICWDDTGKVVWAEGGRPVALVLFRPI